MQLNFEKELIPDGEFLSLDKDFTGFFSEYNIWKQAFNPVFRKVDRIHQIYIYFATWLTGPEDHRPRVHIALVQWQEKSFRFYFHVFELPENDAFYGEIKDTCWMVFKIELVKGWSEHKENDIQLVKDYITKIGCTLKNTASGMFIDKTTVRFIANRCEERPTELLGE